MAQILNVDIQKIRVGTENDVDIAQTANLAFRNHLQPGVVEPPVLVLKLYILKEVPYHKTNE